MHADKQRHVSRSVINTNTFKHVVILRHVCHSLIMIYMCEHSATISQLSDYKYLLSASSAHFRLTENRGCTQTAATHVLYIQLLK